MLPDTSNTWGSSDGLPHSESNFFQQAEDYSDAITYVSTLKPAIDPSRIGSWGVGHSGGLVMPVGATDPRVKVVVAMVPFLQARQTPRTSLLDYSTRLGRSELRRLASQERNQHIPVFANTREQAIAHLTERLIGNLDHLR